MLNLKRYFDFGKIANIRCHITLLSTNFIFSPIVVNNLFKFFAQESNLEIFVGNDTKAKIPFEIKRSLLPSLCCTKQHGTVHTALVPHPLMVALPYISRFSEQLHVKTWDFLNWITYLVMKERTSKMKKWKITITKISSKGHLYISTYYLGLWI